MSYEELGVGVDISVEMQKEPKVFDLLISILYSAAFGGRIELVYPDNVRALSTDGIEIGFMNNVSFLCELICLNYRTMYAINSTLSLFCNSILIAMILTAGRKPTDTQSRSPATRAATDPPCRHHAAVL